MSLHHPTHFASFATPWPDQWGKVYKFKTFPTLPRKQRQAGSLALYMFNPGAAAITPRMGQSLWLGRYQPIPAKEANAAVVRWVIRFVAFGLASGWLQSMASVKRNKFLFLKHIIMNSDFKMTDYFRAFITNNLRMLFFKLL